MPALAIPLKRLFVRALVWAAPAALVPAIFTLITGGVPAGVAAGVWLAHLLRYAAALAVFGLVNPRSGRRPLGYLSGTVAGTLGAGFVMALAGLAFPGWLGAWTPVSRVLFEGAEAAIVGWCLAAAATAWGRTVWSPVLGLLLGTLVAGISSAWLPLPDGIWMAAFWGLRTLVEFAPLAVIYHLWARGAGTDEERNAL
ncbi:MAG: hypothetical protein A2Y64_08230 [Candidatus Coatesbacteria bacterium RBG_13_66_14]|uniref:Uncharacterized protein n=1 Tax=Candidatus Coatesbacteria bacterium RBG_13_66_14 TaxID=1817816 RepID=A0A1F5EXD1_9BACT|nr:MAG: hypothetical protein A2Y64_08230 [Candidatus Coatesbacteria bacterium RBG_13_66_14]